MSNFQLFADDDLLLGGNRNGLGTGIIRASTNLDMGGGNTINNLGPTTTSDQAARKDYVDNLVSNSTVGFSILETNVTTQTLAPNTAYIPTNPTNPVVFTLPLGFIAGNVIRIQGFGLAGWSLAQSLGQTIYFGNLSSTTGLSGGLASTYSTDCIEMVCVVPDTAYLVFTSMGNITII